MRIKANKAEEIEAQSNPFAWTIVWLGVKTRFAALQRLIQERTSTNEMRQVLHD